MCETDPWCIDKIRQTSLSLQMPENTLITRKKCKIRLIIQQKRGVEWVMIHKNYVHAATSEEENDRDKIKRFSL